MFETIVAADIGSAVTRIATKNNICCQATRVALDPENNNSILAVGERSKKLLNATTIYPIRAGTVANTHIAAIMLRRMTLEMTGKKSLYGVSLRIALPFESSDMRKAAALEMARLAGFRSAKIMDSLLTGAVGAGVDVDRSEASLVVDIGRDRLNTGLCANGGVVAETLSGCGSSIIDRMLQNYFAAEYRLLVGARAAECIKHELGSPFLTVNGRNADTGLPASVSVKAAAAREAISPAIAKMSDEIEAAINKMPPESAADLLETGITLIGGGALLYGLEKGLYNRLKIPVHIALNAEHAVIFGMQSYLWRVRLIARQNASIHIMDQSSIM